MESNPEAAILRRKLEQRWPLKEEQIEVGDFRFRVLVVSDVDSLLDELIAKGDAHEDVRDERIPYWADLWASALGLARHIVAQPDEVRGKNVLEVGCGLGLPGMVAAKMGARLTLTDYLPEALQLARLNCLLNLNEMPDFQLMDWRKPRPELAADLVLASDVAYEARAFDPLIQAFPTLLKPDGKLWLSEPSRAWARPFIQQLRDKKWVKDEVSYAILQEGLASKVQVLSLSPF